MRVVAMKINGRDKLCIMPAYLNASGGLEIETGPTRAIRLWTSPWRSNATSSRRSTQLLIRFPSWIRSSITTAAGITITVWYGHGSSKGNPISGQSGTSHAKPDFAVLFYWMHNPMNNLNVKKHNFNGKVKNLNSEKHNLNGKRHNLTGQKPQSEWQKSTISMAKRSFSMAKSTISTAKRHAINEGLFAILCRRRECKDIC